MRSRPVVRVLRVLLVAAVLGCAAGSSCSPDNALLLPARTSDLADPPDATLLARIVHISDTHIVDSQSPARFAGAQSIIPSAWRAWENCSTQILDGILRTTNRLHASERRIDFLIHTGDACDNVQGNELRWLREVFDGGAVTPLSGPDDRQPDERPPARLDPYATFQAQGLYRTGVHGSMASIPWYAVVGNHDTFAMGVFPVVTTRDGSRVAPLPLSGRPGFLLPTVLDPVGFLAYGAVTPADTGPPTLFGPPVEVPPNPERLYFAKEEFVGAMFGTLSEPQGHGFPAPGGAHWYSVAPVRGLRLICLDTSDEPGTVPGLPYAEGCIGPEQRAFLEAELDASSARGELVIVASHHPSQSLEIPYGSVLGPAAFRELLQRYPNVILHLAGHQHRNRVADREGYLEIETCSTLDLPQEGRVIEIWRGDADGAIIVTYRMFSHVDDSLPALDDDPLRELREQARELAITSRGGGDQQRGIEPPDDPAGDSADRQGTWRVAPASRRCSTGETPVPQTPENE